MYIAGKSVSGLAKEKPSNLSELARLVAPIEQMSNSFIKDLKRLARLAA